MNTNIPQKSLICIAQHIRAYVEQCKNEDLADFAEPCTRCYTHGLVDAGFEDEHRPNFEEFISSLAFIGRVDFIKSPIGKVSGLFQNSKDVPFSLNAIHRFKR